MPVGENLVSKKISNPRVRSIMEVNNSGISGMYRKKKSQKFTRKRGRMGTYMCQGAPTFMNTWECTIINTHICTHIQKIVYSNGDVSLATSTKGQFQRYPGLFYLLLPETSSYHKK